MSSAELFGWGALGGFSPYIVIFALPELRRINKSGGYRRFDFGAVLAIARLVVGYSFVGGIASLVLGNEASAPGQAIGMGIAGEVMLKALVGQLQEAELAREP